MLPDATAAVVLAAAASEAFVNEFAELVGMQRQHAGGWNPTNPLFPQLAAAADAILDIEFRHGSTLEKYAAAAAALGQRFDKGAKPYQEFRRLFKLRDALMHVHPVRPTANHEGTQVTNELASRGIALQNTPPAIFAWYDRLGTADVARWACTTARGLIFVILDRVPDPLAPGHPVWVVRNLYGHRMLDDETWI